VVKMQSLVTTVDREAQILYPAVLSVIRLDRAECTETSPPYVSDERGLLLVVSPTHSESKEQQTIMRLTTVVSKCMPQDSRLART